MDACVKQAGNKLHLQRLVSNLRWIKRPASLLTQFQVAKPNVYIGSWQL